MINQSIEISIKGKWISVPAFGVGGKTVFVSGKWLRLAAIHDEDWLETELEDPGACVERLRDQRQHGLRADIFTFTQKLPVAQPKYRYPMEWDSVAVARVGSFKDWWTGLPQETRKNVRRSQKRGVVVVTKNFDNDLVQGLVELNNDSPVRQGRRYTHYGKTFEQVKRDFSAFSDRSDFICAYVGSELVGFLKVVHRGEVASIINLIAKSSHNDKRPANALLAKAAELCEANGVSYLTYGNFNYGNKTDTPIREFKVRNGFEEILMPKYYVPLTAWGALGMKLNLHRGHLGILPQGVLKMGISVRAKWYNLKQSMSRCSSVAERPNCDRQMECSNPPAGSKT